MPTTTYTAQALIEEPAGDVDAIVGSWQVSDDLSLSARGFSLEAAAQGQLQVDNLVEILTGYDADRVTVMRGAIDTCRQVVTPTSVRFAVTGRDAGIQEILDTPITFVWEARPPSVLPQAHTIIREAATLTGVGVGSLAFPDYPLYNSYVATRRSLLDIVSDLLEPWNLFAAVQHVPIVRDNVLHVVRVDWANPPDTGALVTLAQTGGLQVEQRRYSDPPRLLTAIEIIVRGAAYNQPKPNLGTERRFIYNQQRRVDKEILESFAGTYSDFVWLEIATLEEREEGKVQRTVETHYQTTLAADGTTTASDIVRRVEVEYHYYVPNEAISSLVAFEPISLRDAILWATLEVHEGIDDTTGILTPQTRTLKQYYYDDEGQQTAEVESAAEYDTEEGAWRPASVTVRTHSQTSSSTVRTQLTSYTVDPDDDNALTFDVIDSQQVGGQLPTTNSLTGRDEVESIQVQFPALELVDGVPVERRRSSNAWVYENPYIGLPEARRIYDLALAEQALQLTPVRWETVPFEATLLPNLWTGQPIRLEVADGDVRSYWVEAVQHRFDINGARTTGTARRLTESALVDPTTITVAAPTDLVATTVSDTEIALTWTDNATNESSYRVERSLDQVVWTQIATLPANTTSYDDTGLSPGVTYYYRVRAFALV